MDPQEVVTHSFEETFALALAFGKTLKENDLVCFFGGLGAGKTSFIKGLALGASKVREEEIQSPTFTLLNVYDKNPPIYHFDLYRLNHGEDFFSLGFDEYFHQGGICCIEWAEKIAAFIPKGAYLITLNALDDSTRKIMIERKI